jgi:hypothetical protein
MVTIDPHIKQIEESRRWRNWDAAERWRVIQQTITWAEAQATVRRNTPTACLAEQGRKLAIFARRLEGTP